MRRRRTTWMAAGAGVLAALALWLTSPLSTTVTVVGHVDGDTLHVRRLTGQRETVRLIGIDTPELHHPTKPVGCYAQQAKDELARLAPLGASLRLELDTEGYDRYDRTLAYLWTAEGRLVQADLLAAGAGTVLTVRPNTRYAARLYDAQYEARLARRGLWGAC